MRNVEVKFFICDNFIFLTYLECYLFGKMLINPCQIILQHKIRQYTDTDTNLRM